MAKPGVSIPDHIQQEIDDRRHSTKSRSAWLAEAAAKRLEMEDAGEWSDPDYNHREEIKA